MAPIFPTVGIHHAILKFEVFPSCLMIRKSRFISIGSLRSE